MTAGYKARGDLVITIDGPVASGKTTKARLLAHRLGLRVVDTGATYRCLGLAVLRERADPDKEPAVLSVLESADIGMKWAGGNCLLFLGREDVSGQLRTPEVSDAASRVAVHPEVRKRMVALQRKLAGRGVVAEGRDAGTVIFPDADFKIYLDASPEERARRRLKDYRAMGLNKSYEDVLAEINRRDQRDSSRKDSPLRVPEGAFVMRSDREPITAQIDAILREFENRVGPLRRDKKRWKFGWTVTWPLWYIVWGLRVQGREHIPLGPCILAGNHTTNWDPPLMGAAAKREVFFLAKEDIFTWWLAWLIRFFNALKVKRAPGAKDAFQEAITLVREGGCVVIYPEGTRNKTSRVLLPFKLGPAFLSQATGAPIVPCFSTRHKTPWRPLRWLLRKPRLTYTFGEALWPQNYPQGRRGMIQMTKDLRRAILGLGGYEDED